MKTAHNLLLDGFKGRLEILTSLGLGDTNIAIDKTEEDLLNKAIENKDYFEIKNIVKGFHK